MAMRRIRLGWRLAGESWAVLRRDRSLALLPLLGFAAAAGAVLIVTLPAVTLVAVTGSAWVAAPFGVLAAYAATFAAIHYGVALAAMADRSLDGRRTSVAAGLDVARERRGLIARWAAVQLAVGLVISALEASLAQSPAGTAIGTLLGGAANVAWGVASFFVVPLLALEGLRPRAALSRSGAVVRQRWGEGIAGAASIGLAVWLVALAPVALLVALAVAGFAASPALGVALAAAAALAVLATATIATALSTIFRVALLRYAESGEHPGAFAGGDLAVAFRAR
jgi:Family of unknown function (DUF6159)